jgi:hypothetical protein
MPDSRQISILIIAILNVAGIVVGIVSTAWIQYCVDHIACKKTATTGIIAPQTFCMYETVCIDAIHFGVFAMLCSAIVGSAYVLYYIVIAMYHETASPYRPVSGIAAMLVFVSIVIAQYTVVMVLFLKTNGMQQTTVSDLRWPFYVVCFSAVCVVVMFYIQPSVIYKFKMPR